MSALVNRPAPCPFCGGRPAEVLWDRDTGEWCFVTCGTCGAKGPAVECSNATPEGRAEGRRLAAIAWDGREGAS